MAEEIDRTMAPLVSTPQRSAETLIVHAPQPRRPGFRIARLLLLPITVLLCTVWLTTTLMIQQRADAQKQQEALEVQKKQNQAELLGTYRGQIMGLYLHERLQESKTMDDVNKAAHALTIDTLRLLEGYGKGELVRFLFELHILDEDIHTISLAEANLVGMQLDGGYFPEIYLVGCDMHNANLSHSNLNLGDLEFANLEGANLSETNLSQSNLQHVRLEGANLAGANLKDAKGLTPEIIARIGSLQGAIMPDGSIHH